MDQLTIYVRGWWWWRWRDRAARPAVASMTSAVAVGAAVVAPAANVPWVLAAVRRGLAARANVAICTHANKAFALQNAMPTSSLEI
jgi:hypothetical protein